MDLKELMFREMLGRKVLIREEMWKWKGNGWNWSIAGIDLAEKTKN